MITNQDIFNKLQLLNVRIKTLNNQTNKDKIAIIMTYGKISALYDLMHYPLPENATDLYQDALDIYVDNTK